MILHRLRLTLCVCATLFSASACETRFTEELEKASTDGLTLYQRELAQDYLEIAKESHASGRPITGEKMAKRGLEITKGKVPIVRPPAMFLTSPGFTQDYGFMLHLLESPGNPKLYPEKAAEIMALYDCRYATLDKSDECRDGFHKSLDQTFSKLADAIENGAVELPEKESAPEDVPPPAVIANTNLTRRAQLPLRPANIKEKAAPAKIKAAKKTTPPAAPEPKKEVVTEKPKNAPQIQKVIYFKEGQTTISGDQYSALRDIAKYVKYSIGGVRRLSLRGYSDEDGDKRKNMQTSLTRALAVKSMLAGFGVPPELMEAVAFGEGWNEDVKDGNRVVEIKVIEEN